MLSLTLLGVWGRSVATRAVAFALRFRLSVTVALLVKVTSGCVAVTGTDNATLSPFDHVTEAPRSQTKLALLVSVLLTVTHAAGIKAAHQQLATHREEGLKQGR